MPSRVVKVAVNGCGVISMVIADAVVAQPDTELVGLGDIITDYRAASH